MLKNKVSCGKKRYNCELVILGFLRSFKSKGCVMGLSKIGAGKNIPEEFNVIIEIPAHSKPIKYEVDKETGALFVDRFMSTSMRYPCDYGYIPNTLSNDGDPADILVMSPYPLQHGTAIVCRPVGMLNMTDEAGEDMKILAVPTDNITQLYSHVHTYEDLPKSLLDQISHFFEHYKDLEKNKWVKIAGWSDCAAAKKEVLDCVKRYHDTPDKPAF